MHKKSFIYSTISPNNNSTPHPNPDTLSLSSDRSFKPQPSPRVARAWRSNNPAISTSTSSNYPSAMGKSILSDRRPSTSDNFDQQQIRRSSNEQYKSSGTPESKSRPQVTSSSYLHYPSTSDALSHLSDGTRILHREPYQR